MVPLKVTLWLLVIIVPLFTKFPEIEISLISVRVTPAFIVKSLKATFPVKVLSPDIVIGFVLAEVTNADEL